jgi:hypothetical protein
MWWKIVIVALIVFVSLGVYGLIVAGAREDRMKERLLKRLHEEREKGDQDENV